MGYTPLNDPSVSSSTSKFKGKGRAKNQGWVDLERGGGGELTGQEAEKLEMVNEGWERLDESTSGPSTAGLSEYPPPLAMSEEEKEEKRIAEVRSFARSFDAASRQPLEGRQEQDSRRLADSHYSCSSSAITEPCQDAREGSRPSPSSERVQVPQEPRRPSRLRLVSRQSQTMESVRRS